MTHRLAFVRRTELVTAGASIYIGLVWLHPSESFSRAQTFRIMGELGPETVWAVAAIAVGLGLLTKRALATLAFVFLWSIVAIAWLVSNPVAAGPAYGTAAVLNAVFVYRERRRA